MLGHCIDSFCPGMKDLYKTIGNPVRGQFRDKGSKFLAFVYPVRDEDEIRQRIGDLKKEYHDASHHCFAWRLGAEAERYRANDDGEPSGSAGKPILGQLLSRDLTQVLVVVVRYFGGVLLGVGGLINAYRSATSAALDNAVIIERRVEDRLLLEFDYSAMNSVMKMIKDYNLSIENQQFDLDCTIALRVWKRNVPKVMDRIGKIDGCRLSQS